MRSAAIILSIAMASRQQKCMHKRRYRMLSENNRRNLLCRGELTMAVNTTEIARIDGRSVRLLWAI